MPTQYTQVPSFTSSGPEESASLYLIPNHADKLPPRSGQEPSNYRQCDVVELQTEIRSSHHRATTEGPALPELQKICSY